MKKILLFIIIAIALSFIAGYKLGTVKEKNKKQYKEWYFMVCDEQDSLYTADEYIKELESRIKTAHDYMDQHMDRIDIADYLVLRSILIRESTISREENRTSGYREYDCNRDLDTLVDGIYYVCKKKINGN